MKIINFLVLLVLLFTFFKVSTGGAANRNTGEATIVLDNDSYTLPLVKCYSATNTVEGEEVEIFVMSTHESRKSEKTGMRFTVLGTKKNAKTNAFFSLLIEGGFSKGGTTYKGELPFESFTDNRLVYVGNAISLKKMNNKLVNGPVPISISASCSN